MALCLGVVRCGVAVCCGAARGVRCVLCVGVLRRGVIWVGVLCRVAARCFALWWRVVVVLWRGVLWLVVICYATRRGVLCCVDVMCRYTMVGVMWLVLMRLGPMRCVASRRVVLWRVARGVVRVDTMR